MSYKKVKRFLAAGLAAMMLVSLGGCGGDVTTGGTQSSTGTENGDQVVKYSMLDYTSGSTGDIPETTLVEDAIKELVKKNTGIEYEVNKEYVHMGDYPEKLKVLMAGGAIPDVVECGWFEITEVNKYGSQGLYVDFTDYKELMPNLFSMLEKDSTFAERGFSDDGSLYILPAVVTTKGGNYDGRFCGGYRKDILDQHNLPVPTTLEELYEVAAALKEVYPDIYPIMTLEEWEPLDDAIFQSYGIPTSKGDYFNGEEFVYSALQDGYKESVEYLRRLYSEGLIAPDYQIHTSEQGMAALARGEAFLIPQIWNGYVAQWNADDETYPDQEWALVPVLSNENDTAPYIYQSSVDDYFMDSSYFTVISNNSPVKEELIKIYDQYYTDEKLVLEAWGVEGETYEIGEDGEPHIIDEEKYKDANSGTNSPADSRVSNVELADPTIIYHNGEVQEEFLYNFWRENFTEETSVPYFKPITLSEDENEGYANIITAIDTYVDQERAKFITGERSMEEWDTFIEELQDIGDIQKALDIKNAKL